MLALTLSAASLRGSTTHIREGLGSLGDGVTAGSLRLALWTPRGSTWPLAVVRDLLLELAESIADEQALVCEIGQLSLLLQQRRVAWRLPWLRVWTRLFYGLLLTGQLHP